MRTAAFPCRRGFTLVELLIVIGIIGMLLQLLLPAVEASRESARLLQCSNNLRQLGMGCLAHESSFGQFPSGGWGLNWIPDPEEGSGTEQPGGWTYNVLPYIEQSQLHELGRGADEAGKMRAHLQLITTPLSDFHCPSRRAARNYPGYTVSIYHYPSITNSALKVAKTDYAANSGDFLTGFLAIEYEDPLLQHKEMPNENYTGVIYHRSAIEPKHVIDGMSNTYLLGEKNVYHKYYKTHESYGDRYDLYVGASPANCRWTRVGPSIEWPLAPARDNLAVKDWHPARFGSAHLTGCNFVLCDGSVRFVNYDVDADVHRWMGNRRDSEERIHYYLDGTDLVIEPIDTAAGL